jgi:2-keto-4-pentenoate hydratase
MSLQMSRRACNEAAAKRITRAYDSGVPAPLSEVTVSDVADAYSIQDLVIGRLGPADGWKVGARGANAVPLCAPLPRGAVQHEGKAGVWTFEDRVSIELEVALRFGQDVDPVTLEVGEADILALFDTVYPAIEVLRRRVAMPEQVHPITSLADNLGHGRLVLGAPDGKPAKELNLESQEAHLLVDGLEVKHTWGGNPSGDVSRMLLWLMRHCAGRGHTFKRGQIVTTGSCIGMFVIQSSSLVTGILPDVGKVQMQFLRQGA